MGVLNLLRFPKQALVGPHKVLGEEPGEGETHETRGLGVFVCWADWVSEYPGF